MALFKQLLPIAIYTGKGSCTVSVHVCIHAYYVHHTDIHTSCLCTHFIHFKLSSCVTIVSHHGYSYSYGTIAQVTLH